MRSTIKYAATTLAVSLTATLMAGITMPTAAHAASVGAGYSIPHENGSSGSWIGSYDVDGRTVYCIDPDKSGPATAGGYGAPKVVTSFRDLAGRKVSTKDVQRAAYVASKYGNTRNKDRAAAVDTVMYALLGRGKFAMGGSRSEQRMKDSGHYKAIRAIAGSMLADSAKRAGTPTARLGLSKSNGIGNPVTATFTLKTKYGAALSGIKVTADYPLDTTGAATAMTNAKGVATFKFTPTRVGDASMTATAHGLPTAWPTIRFPARGSAQRMIVTGLRMEVPAKANVNVEKVSISVTTKTSHAVAAPGVILTDKVVIKAPKDYRVTMSAALFGPYTIRPTRTSCTDAKKVGEVTFTVTGPGTYRTPGVGPLTTPGYYTWVETAPSTDLAKPVRTRCGIADETSLVNKYQPEFVTEVNDRTIKVGDPVLDHITVSGLTADQPLAIDWALYGPFTKMPGVSSCVDTKKVASGTVTATTNGIIDTPAYVVKAAGYYTYTEKSAETDWYNDEATACGEVPETTLATKYTPIVTTVASSQEASAGSDLYDTVMVKGIPEGEKITIVAYLFGPATGEGLISCAEPKEGRKVTFVATGPGEYKTPSLTVNAPGWFGWQEYVVGTPAVNTMNTPCRVPAETTLVTRPKVPGISIPTGPEGAPTTTVTTDAAPTPTDDAPNPLYVLLLAMGAAIAAVLFRRRTTT